MSEETRRRNTRQRQVVLEELKKLKSHPTAAELYEIARRRQPKISLGTVYRNLEILTQMGLIRKVQIPGSEARFDAELDRHHHVRCVRCGRLDDAKGFSTDPVEDVVRNVNGYQVHGARLELVGLCPACQAASEPNAREGLPHEGG